MKRKTSKTMNRRLEYCVDVTLRIPHKLLGRRLTKKVIASREVELVAYDWGTVRRRSAAGEWTTKNGGQL
jgi:hypothetical protein